MPRIKITLPASFLFQTEINILISHINYGNHLGHDSLISLLHEARLRFLKSLGAESELNVMGKGLILADIAVQYRAEGFYGDVLDIFIGVAEQNKVGFELVYVVKNQQTQAEIARASTNMLFFDYSSRKLAEMPEAFKQALQKNQNQ